MKSRVLFIGNSHMGCVKLAMDRKPELFTGYAIDTMAIPGAWAIDLTLTDGRLHLTSERAKDIAARAVGMMTEASLADYEAVVMVGMGATMMFIGRLYLSHRLLEHRDPKRQLLSPAAFEAMVLDAFLNSGAGFVADRIASAKLPMLVVPEPLLSESVIEVAEWEDVWSGAHVPFLYETYKRHLQSTFAPRSVDVLDPPPETIAAPCFTKLEYSLGAVNYFKPRVSAGEVSRKKFRNDYRHMNEEYGALTCQAIMRWLEARAGA